jgi:hypothetical protein
MYGKEAIFQYFKDLSRISSSNRKAIYINKINICYCSGRDSDQVPTENKAGLPNSAYDALYRVHAVFITRLLFKNTWK